jgi:DNA-binding PadR family transcriptional regulator
LSPAEGAVLGLLAFGERSGYDLLRLAEDTVGLIWTPSRSQLYRVLPRLVELGLARSRGVEQRGRPDKALYEIGEAGRRALRAWLEEVDDDPGPRAVFPLKLFFCDLVPPEVGLAQLAGYRRAIERRLTRFEELGGEATGSARVYPGLVLEHGISRARATLEWVDRAARRLEAESAAGRT